MTYAFGMEDYLPPGHGDGAKDMRHGNMGVNFRKEVWKVEEIKYKPPPWMKNKRLWKKSQNSRVKIKNWKNI
jgi:hypothetical protein